MDCMLTLSKSVFNWNFDLCLPRQGYIALSEFVFCFVLMNIVFAVTNHYKYRKRTSYSGWILILVFCLYAFWDIDYFNFANNLRLGLEDFRDPLYEFLAKISFGSYIVLRLWIWGTAVLLYCGLVRRLQLPQNLACFIFAIFFLTTFSYARASLGMVFYFYGLSFLIVKSKRIVIDIILSIVFFILAFLAHRSMVLLIALTPLAFFKLTRLRLVVAVLTISVCVLALNQFFIQYIQNSLDSNSSIGTAAAKYMSYTNEQNMNWKYWLMTTSHYFAFYIAIAYISYRFFFGKLYNKMPRAIISLYNVSLGTLCAALVFLSIPAYGFWIIGYRFLYMTGIPICLIITYMAANNLCKRRTIWLLMACSLLYSEGFILGKILALS